MADILEKLQALHVWPQFVADTHADIISPRQAQGLYDVGNVATEAIEAIVKLRQQLADAPIMGRTESYHSFRTRQDDWLRAVQAKP